MSSGQLAPLISLESLGLITTHEIWKTLPDSWAAEAVQASGLLPPPAYFGFTLLLAPAALK